MGIYTIKGKQYTITEEEEQKILSERTTITIYVDRLECLDNMTDEEAGQFIKAIMQHFKTGIMPVFKDRYMDSQLSTIKNGAHILEEKYIRRTLANRINSGSPLSPPEIRNPVEASGFPMEATGFNRKPLEAYKDTDTGTNTYTYTNKEKERKTERKSDFPTMEAIHQYFKDMWPTKDPCLFLQKYPLETLPANWKLEIDTFCRFGV